MPLLSNDDLRVFAERGYILVPNAIPEACIHAALMRIDELLAETPPPAGHRGFHFHWVMRPAPSEPLMALLHASATQEAVRALIAPLTIDQPDHIQVAVNVPVLPHRPGGPHLDGLTPPEPSGRPGTFTLLAGMLLTDQTADDMGNLWVWPGSHHVAADYLRRHGPEAILGIAHPTYPMAPPEQIKGRAGDLLLAHLPARPQHRRQHVGSGPPRRLFPFARRGSQATLARLRARTAARVRAGWRGFERPKP